MPRHRRTRIPDRSCPLNHRAAHGSYPQMWRSRSANRQNRPLWPSNPGLLLELQACKLPTVWITAVENLQTVRPGSPSADGVGRRGGGAKVGAGQDSLWKNGGKAVGNVVRPEELRRQGLPGSLQGPDLGRTGRAMPDVTGTDGASPHVTGSRAPRNGAGTTLPPSCCHLHPAAPAEIQCSTLPGRA